MHLKGAGFAFQCNVNSCCTVMITCGAEIRFQCMGTWYDDGNYYSAIADIGRDQYRERFRCMVRFRYITVSVAPSCLSNAPASDSSSSGFVYAREQRCAPG